MKKIIYTLFTIIIIFLSFMPFQYPELFSTTLKTNLKNKMYAGDEQAINYYIDTYNTPLLQDLFNN